MKAISLKKSGYQTAIAALNERVKNLWRVATSERTLAIVAALSLVVLLIASAMDKTDGPLLWKNLMILSLASGTPAAVLLDRQKGGEK